MASLMPYVFMQELDANGTAPLAGGLVYSYAAGTVTPKATYTTYAGDVENANPVVLDSAGRAAIWLGTGGYKFIIKTSAGVTIDTRDNVYAGGGGSGGVSVVVNMAALRALAENASSVVYVEGFYAAEDGGGGWFYWNSASVASEDYGVVIVPTSAPAAGRWIRYFEGKDLSVRWFGAKGDTTTNDTTAVSRCDDYLYSSGIGGAVLFPAGTYLMSSDPTFTCDIKLLDNAVLKWSGYHLDASKLVSAPENNQIFDCAAEDIPTLFRGTIIRPAWFGATGDGSTDDTAAIGKALLAVPAAGAKVYTKAGTYMVDGTVALLNIDSHTELFGDGDATIFKYISAKGASTGMFIATDKIDVYIHDIKLDGNRANNTLGIGISAVESAAASATDFKIKNCHFADFDEYAIQFTGTAAIPFQRLSIENNIINNCAQGIYLTYANLLVSVKNNDIFMDELDDGATAFPIAYATCANVRTEGNRIELESAGTSTTAAITESGTNTGMEYGINQIINYTTTITTTATRNVELDLHLKCLKRLITAKGDDVTSTGNAVLSSNGNVFDVIGTSTINGFSATDWTEGSMVTLQFDDACTLTHNATVAAPIYKLYLLNSEDYTTIAGDAIQFVFCGSIWRQLNYTAKQSLGGHTGMETVVAAASIAPTKTLIKITGTTAIKYISTTGYYTGSIIYLNLTESLTIHHNEGSPGAGYANIYTTTAADITTGNTQPQALMVAQYDGTNWNLIGNYNT